MGFLRSVVPRRQVLETGTFPDDEWPIGGTDEEAMACIFLTSDPIMTSEAEQHSNLRWFTDLLARPIESATAIRPEPFVGTTTGAAPFDRRAFFKRSQIELDPVATQFYFNSNAISDSSIRYLREHVSADDIVVGYELSEQTRTILTRADITYIDIWLHPIRYLDDILFAFSSNREPVFQRLVVHDLDPEHYRLYADRYRISTYKGYKRVDRPVVQDSALFVGQTLQDKAICHHEDGRMLTLLDFRAEFDALGSRCSRVYYSRHPYVKSGDEAIMKYVRSCGFAEIVGWPAYEMLANPHLREVMSISSSVAYEAKYFGKDVTFLYRPVVELTRRYDPRSYVSVYQTFVSGHFWSDILSPVCRVREAPVVSFLDPKDKLRDMLGFYWSYRHVDKVEGMRFRLDSTHRTVQELHGKTPRASTAHQHTAGSARKHDKQELATLQSRIAKAELVSFDVFDTLLDRPLAFSSDLHLLLRPEVERLAEGAIEDWPEVRRLARSWVPRDERVGEEVPLEARYRAIAKRFGLSEDMQHALLQLELDAERRMLEPRQLGVKLFREAIQAGRRVVLLSDTYFDSSWLGEVLSEAGIVGYERLFASSETGVLKHSGSAYKMLVAATGVDGRKILHIGDDPRSDGEQAEAAGVTNALIPRSTRTLTERLLYAKNVRTADPRARAILSGLVGGEIAWSPYTIEVPSHVGGTAEGIGFALLGPLVLGFAKWLLDRTREDGVTDLLFLSRDGEIMKRVYDIVSHLVPEAPRSHYLLASRRALSVAAVETPDDIVALLDTNFTPLPLARLLLNRFGLRIDAEVREILARNGFDDPDQHVSYREGQVALRAAVRALSPQILANAAGERRRLLAHYGRQGFQGTDRQCAIVDIGHHGSMQCALSNLLGEERLGGYYFALFDGAPRLRERSLPHDAYLGTSLRSDSTHPYVKHILLFELLFLNANGSFVCMDDKTPPGPRFLPTTGEEARIAFIESVHDAAVRFSQGAVRRLGERLLSIPLPAEELITPYVAMLERPTSTDAKPLLGVAFENVYSGRDVRYIIHPEVRHGEGLGQSVWRQGAVALAGGLAQQSTWNTRLAELGGSLGVLSDRKRRKLERDPQAFFRDSKHPLLRMFSRFIPPDAAV